MGNVKKKSSSDGHKKLSSRKTPDRPVKEEKKPLDHGCCSFNIKKEPITPKMTMDQSLPPLEFIDTEDDQTEIKSDTRVRLFGTFICH